MISGVYTITNLLNNKIYVGYSKDVIKRLRGHENKLVRNKHHCIHLQRAVNEYGIDNFKFELLEECPAEILASQENYWCNLLNSHDDKFGYNDKPTHPDNRPTQNEKSIKKIREARYRQIFTTESQKKKSLKMTGVKKSEEHRKNISKGRKGIIFTEEHKNNIRKANLLKSKKLKKENI